MFEKLFKKKKSLHEDVEVYYSTGRSIEVEISKGEIESSSIEEYSAGYGVRVVFEGREGFSYTRNPRELEDCLKRAEDISQLRTREKGFRLPEPITRYPKVGGTFDKKVGETTFEDCIKLAGRMLHTCEKDVRIVEGSFSVGLGSTVIENSNGIRVREKGTSSSAAVQALAGKESTGAYFKSSRSLLNPDVVKDKAVALAKASQNPVKISSGTYDILLEPLAVDDLFSNLLVPALNGDRVYRRKSKLAGKINKKVASPILTIIDDGTLKGGLSTGRFDDEGVPTQKTTLIEDGILKGFLYDTHTAFKARKKSTGNAARSFNSLPGIGPTNFIVKVKDRHKHEELVSETKKGLLVESLVGAHTSNRVSGDFAVELENTFLIRNGNLGKCIRSGILAGNIFHLLEKIDAAADNTEQVGAVVTPSLRIKGLEVVC